MCIASKKKGKRFLNKLSRSRKKVKQKCSQNNFLFSPHSWICSNFVFSSSSRSESREPRANLKLISERRPSLMLVTAVNAGV